MYDIRQFKPVLYVLVMLGISGFALAAQSPALWVLAAGAILLNAWLVRTNRFVALPRLLSNLITLLALAYAFITLRQGGGVGSSSSSPILVIGQFLVLLQVVKLFEQRGNRDYAQLLVLSLLLMVAAAISTATLNFGILFICYLFLALYASLLFHLKVETDHAKAAIGVPEDKLNPMTLRQDQRYLSRSMRRLTVLVSIVSISTAVVVFLFFPRNTGANMFGPMQYRPTQTLTGFSDQVSFQQVAQITQNPQIVAYVKVWDGDRPVQGTQTIVLRGATLDLYTGNAQSMVQWQWQKSHAQLGNEYVADRLDTQTSISLDGRGAPGTIRQEFMLEPTGTETLFAMGGVTDFRALSPVNSDSRLRFQPRDQTMRLEPTLDRTLRYEVFSNGRLFATPDALPEPAEAPATRDSSDSESSISARQPRGAGASERRRAFSNFGASDTRPSRSSIDPQIEAYARREDVSGSDAQGPLAARRPVTQVVNALDQQIAENIRRHLTGEEFAYTLDLSDARRVMDRDPVVAFLYDLKRGHCEYFAGAMTLMCQSLGLQARLVVGFKCDEFNNMTHSYVVRQSHAHAWVEVLNDKLEWIVFDPTSGRDSRDSVRQAGMWSKIKQFVGYLEYTWANSVVAYDKDTRASFIQNVENRLGQSANTGFDSMRTARERFDLNFFKLDPIFSSKLITFLIFGLIAAMLISVGWFLFERWKMRRRARRIGLNTLPRQTQLKLARQLGFYDDLLLLLARNNIVSPASLTPLEFSRTLAFLPNELFDTVRRITQIFYRIRYGQAQLSNMQQRRMKTAIARVDAALQRTETTRSPRP